jgi:iron complex outermembrane receptor protein
MFVIKPRARWAAVGAVLAAAGMGAAAPACADVATASSDTSSPGQNGEAQASATSLEEIVVTARRREEDVQSVPITVAVLSATQLNEENVTTANDLARVSPGLSIMNTAANHEATTFSIRGQGSTFGSGPGVIPYFDDVPNFSGASATSGGAPPIFDLQNIQVLKGPQGTLFGRNTTGGAVLFTPQMPTDQTEGYVDTRLGNYARRDLEFAIGGSIVDDKLMFRISGQSLNRDGYTKYLTDGSMLDNEDSQAIRAILTFKPVDSLQNTTLFQATGYHTHGDGAIFTKYSTDPAVNFLGAALAPQLAQQLAEQQQLGIRVALGDFPLHQDKIDTLGGINTTQWDINQIFGLKNIVSYLKTTTARDWDLDGTDLPILGVLNPTALNYQNTEELQGQLHDGPVSAQAGYYFERLHAPFQYGFAEVLGILDTTVASAQSSHNTSQGIYAQGDWKVIPALNLTAGARYTRDDFTQDPTGTTLGNGTTLPPISDTAAFVFTPGLERKFHALTWNIAADYAVDPDLNVYAHASKGYKQGGFNGTAPPAYQQYQPEYVIDYELGIKGRGEIGGWQVRYDIDGFYDDYTNIQRDQNIIYDDQALTVIENAAAGYITGAELQVTIVPVSFFELTASDTYLNAKYRHYFDPTGGDISASRFPNTPTDQLMLTPLVIVPIPSNLGALTVQSNIYYQSSFATDAFNVANGNPIVDLDVPGANLPGYTLVNFRIDWKKVYGSSFSAGLYVLNAFNRIYATGTDNQLNSLISTETTLYGPPRFYGVELRYEFGH